MSPRDIGPYEPTEPFEALPPSNTTAEQMLLGALLLNNAGFDRVAGVTAAEEFYEPLHGKIYGLIADRLNNGSSASPVTLLRAFDGDGAMDSLGGAASYLGSLVANVITTLYPEHFAQEIHTHYLNRQLMALAGDVRDAAAQHRDPIETADQFATRIYDLTSRGNVRGPVHLSVALREAMQKAEEAYKRGGPGGVCSGLIDVDRVTGGFTKGNLIVVAGATGMGKTALALSLGRGAAEGFRREADEEEGQPRNVLFFSLEMSREEIGARFFADDPGISTEHQRGGDGYTLTQRDFDDMEDAIARMGSLPFWIDDTPGITVSQMRARARAVSRHGGLGLVIVDYIQIVGTSGAYRNNRVQEISEISRGLKAMAKDLGVPVIALAQLSRKPDDRDNPRPRLSDLRESGSIEHDADMVLFVYREEYYLARSEPQGGGEEWSEWRDAMDKAANRAELNIAKNRHGQTRRIDLHFDPQRARFGNLSTIHAGARL